MESHNPAASNQPNPRHRLWIYGVLVPAAALIGCIGLPYAGSDASGLSESAFWVIFWLSPLVVAAIAAVLGYVLREPLRWTATYAVLGGVLTILPLGSWVAFFVIFGNWQ